MAKKKPARRLLRQHYSVNVSDEDKVLIDRAATFDDKDKKASAWIRLVALKAARELVGVS